MKTVLACILCMVMVCSFAADPIKLTVNTSDTTFSVTLPANATTGYQWALLDYDRSFLRLASSHYEVPQSKMVGAGGQMMFDFELISGRNYPESTILTFKYFRPWEHNEGMIQPVVVNFVNKAQ